MLELLDKRPTFVCLLAKDRDLPPSTVLQNASDVVCLSFVSAMYDEDRPSYIHGSAWTHQLAIYPKRQSFAYRLQTTDVPVNVFIVPLDLFLGRGWRSVDADRTGVFFSYSSSEIAFKPRLVVVRPRIEGYSPASL